MEKARLAVERRNYSFAIELYQEILQIDPNNVEARRSLRAVEARQVKEAGTSRVAAVLKNLGTYVKLLFPTKNHEQRMIDCERFLMSDPTNPSVLKKLAAAALASGYTDTAAAVLEDLHQQHPKDVAGLRMLQATYHAMGNIQRALEVNRDILKIAPGDREASQAIRDLSATDMSAKFEVAARTGERLKAARKVMRSEKEAERLGRELRTEEDVRAEIADTKGDIAKRPDDSRLYVKLGNLYMRLRDFDEAEEQYEKAKDVSPTEYSITMKLQDVEIARMRADASALAKEWKANPKDKAARERYRKAYNELLGYRLQCFEERERQFPTDLQIAFDLATLYFEKGMLDEAIMRYQRTVNDPKNRAQSLLNLGICFQKKEQFDLALHRFTEGIQAIEIWNEMKMKLLYQRADCCEQMGDPKKAKEDFTAIYEKDISFKDVAKRLEKLQAV
jgi:tetratricopeptide (TPR) repeat protein